MGRSSPISEPATPPSVIFQRPAGRISIRLTSLPLKAIESDRLLSGQDQCVTTARFPTSAMSRSAQDSRELAIEARLRRRRECRSTSCAVAVRRSPAASKSRAPTSSKRNPRARLFAAKSGKGSLDCTTGMGGPRCMSTRVTRPPTTSRLMERVRLPPHPQARKTRIFRGSSRSRMVDGGCGMQLRTAVAISASEIGIRRA